MTIEFVALNYCDTFLLSVITVPEIEYGYEGSIKITVTSTQTVTKDIRDRYSITWTDYEGHEIDSDRNDYLISHEPSARLNDNEILIHELSMMDNIINVVIIL